MTMVIGRRHKLDVRGRRGRVDFCDAGHWSLSQIESELWGRWAKLVFVTAAVRRQHKLKPTCT